MRFSKPLILIFICLFFAEWTMAQRSNSRGRNHKSRPIHNYKATRIRGAKAKIVCPVFENSRYPYHGLGFKFGDPFALTYKFYPNKNLSLALDVGKASSGLYNRYFREKFQEYANEGDTLAANATVTYSSHQVKTDLIWEFKVLYHLEANKVSPGLQVYAGAGWEWKNTRLNYGYFYNRTSPNGGELVNDFKLYPQRRFTMGPQVVIGIEYAYFQIPISAFMELEYFMDVQADPGWQRFEGGVGLRYIF